MSNPIDHSMDIKNGYICMSREFLTDIDVNNSAILMTEDLGLLRQFLLATNTQETISILTPYFENICIDENGKVSPQSTPFQHGHYLMIWLIAENIPGLKKLDVSGLFLQDLPPNFSNFNEVTHLNLSENFFYSLPESILLLPNLQELNLQGNPTNLQDVEFQHPISLDLRSVSVEGLPRNVKKLFIDGDQIEDILPQIAEEGILEELHIEHFEQDPNDPPSLPSIKRLYVSESSRVSLPSFLQQLDNLELLSWEYGKIIHWPDNLLLSNLQELSLSNNRIAWFSGNLKYLPALRKINISHNNLRTIPRSIRNCAQLTHLNVSHCRIQSLGDNILSMHSLISLNISHNPLCTVTDTLKDLALQHFDIRGTHIDDHQMLSGLVNGIALHQESMLVTSIVTDSEELQRSLLVHNILNFVEEPTSIDELDLSSMSLTTEELASILKLLAPRVLHLWKTQLTTTIPEDCPRPQKVYAEQKLFSFCPESWEDVLEAPQQFLVSVESRFRKATFRSLLLELHPDIFDEGYDIPNIITLPHNKVQYYLDLFSSKEILLQPVQS